MKEGKEKTIVIKSIYKQVLSYLMLLYIYYYSTLFERLWYGCLALYFVCSYETQREIKKKMFTVVDSIVVIVLLSESLTQSQMLYLYLCTTEVGSGKYLVFNSEYFLPDLSPGWILTTHLS